MAVEKRTIDIAPPAAIACEEGTCRAAVKRAYSGMLAVGSTETRAFEAALRVLRHHHPELAMKEAAATVEYWMRPERLQ